MYTFLTIAKRKGMCYTLCKYTAIGWFEVIITFFGHSSYEYNANEEEKLLHMIENVSHNNSVDFYLGGYGKFDMLAEKCAKK